MISRNKLSVINNPFQTKRLKVLTVCSGGVLRSPTAATLLVQPPFDYNVRSCGTADYALIPLTEELLMWADEIVCAEGHHAYAVEEFMDKVFTSGETRPLIHILGIEDDYDYMDPTLVEMMLPKLKEIFRVK